MGLPAPHHPDSPGLAAMAAALGPDRVHTTPETCEFYASDDGARRCLPAAVAFPASHAQVEALVAAAFAHDIALVPRGAGSGNVGGALPVPGSVVVSFECMRRVIEFNPAERLMVVEAGVPTAEIDALARSAGLFYPPDPGSAPYCHIGGNLAMNAAGPGAVKYGVTRDYVLGLRAVAGDARALVTGCRTTKGVVGYDLTRLLVGSEGTLALITEATLRLLPAPATVGTLRVCYASGADACAAAARVMTAPVVPSALEFMDSAAIAAIQRAGAAEDLPRDTRALLMVEADGDPTEVARALAVFRAALDGPGMLQLRQGDNADAVAALWRARRALSGAVKALAPRKINEDVVVPIPRLATLVATIEQLAREYRLLIVTFGHAGNGNLHVNLMVHPDDADEMQRARACLAALFKTVLALGGTLSGEHGIGYEKREFVPLELSSDALARMRALKRVFDPKGILNPGKMFPE
ncbi:MAG: FAD-binding oxidoreductase [Gammaproteobacteria bacterium]